MTPTVHGERAVNYEIRPLFVYSICYLEVYRHFLEGVGFGWQGFVWGGFLKGEPFLGRDISWRDEYRRGNATLWGFDKITIKNSF